MISMENAIEIATTKFSGYPVKNVWDMGDKWLISPDTGEPPIPGICCVFVDKTDGKVEGFFPPRYKGPLPTDEQKVL